MNAPQGYDINWFKPTKTVSGAGIEIGRLYWAPIPLPRPDKYHWRLQLRNNDPNYPLESDFYVQRFDIQAFEVSASRPMPQLRLPKEQIPLIIPHKIRPVIALTRPMELWRDGQKHGDDAVLALPISDVLDKAGSYKFTETFLLKVQAFHYPPLFHLPPSPCGHFREGLVRFEWAQAVAVSQVRPYHDDIHLVALSNDAVWLIQLWFCNYLNLPIPPDDRALLQDYVDSKQRQLKDHLAGS